MERVVLLFAAVMSTLLCQVRPTIHIIQLLSSFIFHHYSSFRHHNTTTLTHLPHPTRLYVYILGLT